jgi:hypothetical protein
MSQDGMCFKNASFFTFNDWNFLQWMEFFEGFRFNNIKIDIFGLEFQFGNFRTKNAAMAAEIA